MGQQTGAGEAQSEYLGALGGMAMPENEPVGRGPLRELRVRREGLVRQVKQNQETIERSQELIRRIDGMLAKADEKPGVASTSLK
jgi:hypothetical protein